MFCDHSQLRRRHKTAGQDVFLEYRRHAKSSWSGSARHPPGTTVPLLVKSDPFGDIPAAPGGLPNASRSHSKLRTRSPLSREFCAGNEHLVTTSALNPQPFTSVHSHAAGQKLSGRIFAVSGGKRVGFWPGGRRMALRGSQGVRARGVMVNHASATCTYCGR